MLAMFGGRFGGFDSAAQSTLTEGRPTFEKALAASGFDEAEVLRLAASLDQGSEHPLAGAIVAAARGMSPEAAESFDSASGIGVSGKIRRRAIALSNAAFMRRQGVDVGALAT